MTDRAVDLERLLRIRVVVARVGEMDLAGWWNTRGQLGPLGAAAVRRGLPRTHWFAQARSVFAVAGHRCDEVFSPARSATIWRLPAEIEERFDARWEHWLDDAPSWNPFFEQVAALEAPDVPGALDSLGLARDAARQTVERIQVPHGSRSVALPEPFTGTNEDVDALAAAFSRSSQGSLVVPYATLGDASA